MNKRTMESMISLDFWGEISSKYARRRFFWIFAILLIANTIALFAIQFLLSEGAVKIILLSLLGNTDANLLSILIFYFIYVYFLGAGEFNNEANSIRPTDISDLAKSLPINSSRYLFWGRSGSFFRAYTLPKLDSESRDRNKPVEITVILPDPLTTNLQWKYDEILNSLGEGGQQDALISNVIATFIIGATTEANNSNMRIDIFLTRSLPAFRIDMSDIGCLLTQDAKTKPGLFFAAESQFFDMFRSIGLHEISMSRKVEFDRMLFRGSKNPLDHVSQEKIRQIVGNFPIDQDLINRVTNIISTRGHRYK